MTDRRSHANLPEVVLGAGVPQAPLPPGEGLGVRAGLMAECDSQVCSFVGGGHLLPCSVPLGALLGFPAMLPGSSPDSAGLLNKCPPASACGGCLLLYFVQKAYGTRRIDVRF